MANKKMKELQLATEITDIDYLIGYLGSNEKSSRYSFETVKNTIVNQHNADSNAHSEIREMVEQVETAISAHTSNTTNPHAVTLSQVALQQGTNNTVLSGNLYEDSEEAINKLITQAEATAIAETVVQAAPLYMGQLKYGADTLATRNTITGMQTNDICGVQATQLSYIYNGSSWQEQPHGNDAIGQYYDIVKWYGTWDGTVHTGDVSARITCAEATTPVWNLIVYDDKIVDGEITTAKLANNAVTDSKLGNRSLVSQSASNNLIPANQPQPLTTWLQGIRNNLLYLFDNKANNLTEQRYYSNNEQPIAIDNLEHPSYGFLALTIPDPSERYIEIHQTTPYVIVYLQICNDTENDITLNFKYLETTKKRRQNEESVIVRSHMSVEVSYVLIFDHVSEEQILTITSSTNLTTYSDD